MDCAAGTTSVGGSVTCVEPTTATLVESHCATELAACSVTERTAVIAALASTSVVGEPNLGPAATAVMACVGTLAESLGDGSELGCTDPSATNYNPHVATLDDSCEYDCATLAVAEGLSASARCISFDGSAWGTTAGGDPTLNASSSHSVIQGRLLRTVLGSKDAIQSWFPDFEIGHRRKGPAQVADPLSEDGEPLVEHGDTTAEKKTITIDGDLSVSAERLGLCPQMTHGAERCRTGAALSSLASPFSTAIFS